MAPYGLEEVELKHERCRLDAAGPLYVPLTEYKEPTAVKPSLLSVDTPGHNRHLPVKNRFEDALKREHVTEGTYDEKMEETLSEPEEDMDMGRSRLKK